MAAFKPQPPIILETKNINVISSLVSFIFLKELKLMKSFRARKFLSVDPSTKKDTSKGYINNFLRISKINIYEYQYVDRLKIII